MFVLSKPEEMTQLRRKQCLLKVMPRRIQPQAGINSNVVCEVMGSKSSDYFNANCCQPCQPRLAIQGCNASSAAVHFGADITLSDLISTKVVQTFVQTTRPTVYQNESGVNSLLPIFLLRCNSEVVDCALWRHFNRNSMRSRNINAHPITCLPCASRISEVWAELADKPP
jgi:hypothetical protein